MAHRNYPNEDDISPLFSRKAEPAVTRGTPSPNTHAGRHRLPVIHDEVMLDGNSRLNLATFVGTWMEPYAQRLYADTVDKNLIDKDEYPATAAIEERCWRILADLWHAPSVKDALAPRRSAPRRRPCWPGWR